MAIGLSAAFRTQAPWHNSSTGQTRAQVAPSRLLSRIVIPDPRTLPVEILRMKPGMSMWVGQACMHGASKQ